MTTREMIETAKYYQSILEKAEIGPICEDYARRLAEQKSDRIPRPYRSVSVSPSQLAYCGWMLGQMRDMDKSQSDKFLRWLCFIQGVFWAAGLLGVQDARDHIRPLLKK